MDVIETQWGLKMSLLLTSRGIESGTGRDAEGFILQSFHIQGSN